MDKHHSTEQLQGYFFVYNKRGMLLMTTPLEEVRSHADKEWQKQYHTLTPAYKRVLDAGDRDWETKK